MPRWFHESLQQRLVAGCECKRSALRPPERRARIAQDGVSHGVVRPAQPRQRGRQRRLRQVQLVRCMCRRRTLCAVVRRRRPLRQGADAQLGPGLAHGGLHVPRRGGGPAPSCPDFSPVVGIGPRLVGLGFPPIPGPNRRRRRPHPTRHHMTHVSVPQRSGFRRRKVRQKRSKRSRRQQLHTAAGCSADSSLPERQKHHRSAPAAREDACEQRQRAHWTPFRTACATGDGRDVRAAGGQLLQLSAW